MESLLVLSAISIVGAASFGSLYYTTKRKFKHFKTQGKDIEIEKLKTRIDYIERLSEILSASKTKEKSENS